MYLKRLDIQGFKTFAQRSSFVFPPGITAVVGPNGSGKSNLSDAVRWVLGEQSFVNLRCKKTEDLIYGGGKGRAPLGFADVSLTIDNGDRLLPLPYDEVTIGRRAYRSGENEYFINRARVRLRDLLDAVAPLGSSYTLINQGLVDAALALQPEDRQKLFEDAAEIGPYQAKKAEAERRLRETEANLVRLSDLLQEQAPQLRTLHRQARDAEAVGAVAAELSDLLGRHYRRLYAISRVSMEAAADEEHRCAGALARVRGQRASTGAALQRERGLVWEQRSQLVSMREAEASLDRRIATNLREHAVVDERLTGLRLRQDELLEREQMLREERTIGAAECDMLGVAMERGAAVVGEGRATLRERSRKASEVVAARQAAETALATMHAALARKAAAVGAAEAHHHQLARHAAGLGRDVEGLQRETARAAAELADARRQVSEADDLLARADAALHDGAAGLDGAQHVLRIAREERASAAEVHAAVRRVRADLETRYETLARLIQSGEGTFPGVKAAMRWAKRAGRTDFRLVASIVKVPQDLETAIEAALGSRLQQIVVDCWETAEAAIAELKRSHAGRATFLPLDTLRASRRTPPPARPATAGILGCAADMLDYDPRYAAVVDLLLGRTLIAADLPAARGALKGLDGGWGLVTLAGEQVASTGALTGGSAGKESGTLRREREYRELPARIEEAQAEVMRREAQLARQETTVEDALGAVRAAEAAMRDARAGRDRRQGILETRRRELHRAEDGYQALLKRAERLGSDRSEAEKEHATAAANLESARGELALAREAVEQAEQELPQRQHAARADEEAVQALREALLRAESDQRVRAEAYERRRRSLQQAEHELGTIKDRVAQFDVELSALGGELARLQAEGAALAAESHALTGALRPVETALDESEKRLQGFEAAERTATATVIECEQRHASAAIELQGRRSEHQLLEQRAAADGIELHTLSDDPATAAAQDGEPPELLDSRIEQLRGRLRRMGPVNALAPAEYATLVERHAFLETQLEDVRTTTATLREAICELDELMDVQFHTTFDAVAHEFKTTFTQLFGGGSAQLSLVEPPTGDGEAASRRRGVDIVAQPPGKRKMHLQLLSGGERALTAAALLFAILKQRPRPFCIMDEVDAALDEANVVRFREALLELAEGTQFVVVTHNRGTVEAADTLYGISLGEDGASRVLSLRFVEGRDGLVETAAAG